MVLGDVEDLIYIILMDTEVINRGIPMNVAALVKVNNPAVLAVYPVVPIHFVNIPGLWQAYDVSVGWTSPDGEYKIVDIVQFSLPLGQQIVGVPSYTINAQLIVNEIFNTVPLTPVPPSIDYIDLLGKMTDDEIVALQAKIASEAVLLRWDRQAQRIQTILLEEPFAAIGKTLMVAKGVLTLIRANHIFSQD